MKTLILFFILFESAFASATPPVNILEMRQKIDQQNRRIQELSREMFQIESNLVNSNKKYSKLSEDRLNLEEGLSVAKKNADIDNENLKKKYQETKNLLLGTLLNKIEKEDTPANMLSKKILITNLEKQLIDLEGLMKSNKEVQDDVGALSERLTNSLSTEKELVTIIRELDQQKMDLKNKLEELSQKNLQDTQEFKTLNNKMAMEREANKKILKKRDLAPLQITEEIKIPSITERLEGEFYSPLAVHQNIEYQKKGVTYNFIGKNEVRATKSGKIIYTGALANYGNVIMIDHGKEMRSVILGQFDYVVKNGDPVKDSQLIGYTKSKLSTGLGEGKIYFEVRKNNLAQNTYMLLDKKSLAKNSSK